MPLAPLHVQRLALLRDGTTVGCFTVRCHETHVAVLEPNGHAYTYVGPNNRPSRHLTPTLLSTHREMVAAVVRFRNRYACCAVDADADAKLPYVHSAVVADAAIHSRRRRRQSPATACWPRLESYATSRLWNNTSKAFEIESLDGTSRVVLHASGKLVDVQFLADIKRDDDASDDQSTWVQQSFPVVSTPACFVYPVRILLRARIARGSHTDSFRVEELSNSQSTVALPRNGAVDARPTFRPLVLDAPTKDPHANQVNSVDITVRWARGLSRSLDSCVAVEQTDGVELLVVSEPSMAPTVWIMAPAFDPPRRSVIEYKRGFFRVFDDDGLVAHQFTVETLPVEMATLGRDFPRTTAILHYAAELFHAASTQQPSRRLSQVAADANSPKPVVDTTQPLEDVTNELGRFRIFADGRVRVVFADRTILQVSPSLCGKEECSFVDRDGSTSRCTNYSASETQQRYIAMAADFAQWAFATPEQRFRRYQLQLEQQQLVAQELHKISIRHELNRSLTLSRSGGDSAAVENLPHHTETSLSRETIVHLQQETQRHMTHIRTLLRGAEHAADTHRD